MFVIPLTNLPRQTLRTNIPVDGRNLYLELQIVYNGVGGYWMMSIKNMETRQTVISNLNLVASHGRFANLLALYSYLNLGSIYVVPAKKGEGYMPDQTNLGTGYFLVWGDSE